MGFDIGLCGGRAWQSGHNAMPQYCRSSNAVFHIGAKRGEWPERQGVFPWWPSLVFWNIPMCAMHSNYSFFNDEFWYLSARQIVANANEAWLRTSWSGMASFVRIPGRSLIFELRSDDAILFLRCGVCCECFSPPSCLVPGAGLGRLACEISRLGMCIFLYSFFVHKIDLSIMRHWQWSIFKVMVELS